MAGKLNAAKLCDYQKDGLAILSDVDTDDDGGALLDPPPHLLPLALEEWRRLVPLLRLTHDVRAIDSVALECYCQCYAQYRDATDDIARNGLMVSGVKYGEPVQVMNPMLNVQAIFESRLMRYASMIGLSPSARGKIKQKYKTTKEEDDFNEFVGGGHDQHEER